jgi:fluoride exporter
MSASLWVMVGSALGGLARYWLTIAVLMATRSGLPWGTLLINVLGSFVIGCFGALTAPGGRLTVSPDMRLFVMVGLCGGFTTFSAFSLQTFELIQAEAFGWAAAYILGSVALCLFGVWAGFAAVR